MYPELLHLHGGLRWLILLTLLIVFSKYLVAWSNKKRWSKADNIVGIIFTALMDLQLLTGLVLYFFSSPITKTALNDFGAAMKNADLRFYAVEHFVIMLLAVVFVHIGRSRSKRESIDRLKFRKALFWFSISTVLIIIGIPWERI